MLYVTRTRIKKSWEFDQDVIDSLGEWCEKTRMPKGVAVQLGIWTVLHLSAQQRQEFLDMMDRREPVVVLDASEAGDTGATRGSGQGSKCRSRRRDAG